jgi:cell division transport system ATP-binding protein
MIINLQNALIVQQNEPVLTDVNLQLLKGEFAYLIGKSGSGKSSLLKTLYGALALQNGSGLVAGYEIKGISRKHLPLLRRKLGMVFQEYNLLSDRSIDENLYFVLEATGWRDAAAMKARIFEVLDWVNLTSKANDRPHQLSGGERQRVAIARALLNTPELIIADEPTGNLDPQTSDELLTLLIDLSKKNNTAVLFATHDYRIIERFPARIIKCENGKIIDENKDLKAFMQGL